jgi:hypothetical protein
MLRHRVVWQRLHGRRARLPPRRHQREVVLSPAARQLRHDSLINMFEQLKGFYADQRVVVL